MITIVLETLKILCISACFGAIGYFVITFVLPIIKQKAENAESAKAPVDPVQALLEVTEKTQSFRLAFHREYYHLLNELNQNYCLDSAKYDVEIARLSAIYVQLYGEKSALVAVEVYRIPAFQEAQFVANFLNNLSITFPAMLRDGMYVGSTVYQENLAKQLPQTTSSVDTTVSL